MNRELKIGNLLLDSKIIVGPMAGISNAGFRSMIRQFSPGLIYTEMVSDKAICFKNRKTVMMTEVKEEERPLSLQLFGHDLETMVQAAVFLDQNTACDIIDINMGCPVPKVVNNNGGSALMKEPEYAEELIRNIVANVNKPVTVKIRAGWDKEHINCVEMAKRLERAGAAMVCLHPRTRSEYYAGHSNWELIREVKQAVSIPVVGNGDIKTVEDMVEMEKETGCDGFMVSRGCLGNPWLIRKLVHYERYGEILEDPSAGERIEQCLQHADRLIALKGELTAIKEMRGHACWYITGLPNNNRIKGKINDMKTREQLHEIMQEYKRELEDL